MNKSCWCMTAEGKKSFIVLVLKLASQNDTDQSSVLKRTSSVFPSTDALSGFVTSRRVKTLQRALVHKPMFFFSAATLS